MIVKQRYGTGNAGPEKTEEMIVTAAEQTKKARK